MSKINYPLELQLKKQQINDYISSCKIKQRMLCRERDLIEEKIKNYQDRIIESMEELQEMMNR